MRWHDNRVMYDSLRLPGKSAFRPADAQCVHAVLQHSSADAQHARCVGLNIIGLLQGVQNDLSFKFHDGLLQRETTGERIVPKGCGSRIGSYDRGEVFGLDDA